MRFLKKSLARNFEEEVINNIKIKILKFSICFASQEYISSTISTICKIKIKPLIFGQHRCHSIYLTFGGNKGKLIDELIGKKLVALVVRMALYLYTQSINMFGHDGLMGSNGPIGVGALMQQINQLLFFWRCTRQEDYVLAF